MASPTSTAVMSATASSSLSSTSNASSSSSDSQASVMKVAARWEDIQDVVSTVLVGGQPRGSSVEAVVPAILQFAEVQSSSPKERRVGEYTPLEALARLAASPDWIRPHVAAVVPICSKAIEAGGRWNKKFGLDILAGLLTTDRKETIGLYGETKLAQWCSDVIKLEKFNGEELKLIEVVASVEDDAGTRARQEIIKLVARTPDSPSIQLTMDTLSLIERVPSVLKESSSSAFLEKGLQHGDSTVRSSAIRAFSRVPADAPLSLATLVPTIIKMRADAAESTEVLKCLIGLAVNSPPLLLPHHSIVMSHCLEIAKNPDQEAGNRFTALNCVTVLCELAPKIVSPSLLQEIVTCCLKIAEIPEIDVQEWANGDIDDDIWKFKLEQTAPYRIASALNGHSDLSILQTMADERIKDADWKRRISGMEILIVCGKISDAQSIEKILKNFTNCLKDDHPIVRNGSIRALRWLFRFTPTLIEQHNGIVLPTLMSALSDPVARVAAHAAAAINHFIHDCMKTASIDLAPLMLALVESLQAKYKMLLEDRKTRLLARIVSAIAAVGRVNAQLLIDSPKGLMETMKIVYRDGSQCKDLSERASVCLHLVAQAIGKEKMVAGGFTEDEVERIEEFDE